MVEKEVFVDTGAWVALAVTDDKYHLLAKKIYPNLFKNYQKLVTTNLVVAETYVILRKSGSKQGALSFLDKVAKSPRIEKIYSHIKLEEEAYELLKRYKDQDFSFTDAVSFCLMKEKGIKKAFAFDNHFKTAGFVLISE
jgi:predicted nucleic acid-binding protein